MLMKLGVDISRLKRPVRRILSRIDAIYTQHGEEAVITSTYEGNHSPSSLHYDDNAIDFRRPQRFREIVSEIKDAIGNDYDVILEGTHIHIEYDPE